ncbi:hypothetical protein K4L44_12660 [Halosquirtibacter laminarini]|uniref:Uncharacterized protein n=1 Tax=Halosquirtibacter laminarini TaxID=3374600 RepID=A0AC61NJ98_9BACT|nr:hypothetical protein K4L44_12660 [Prolixibacteraceae bacterium]
MFTYVVNSLPLFYSNIPGGARVQYQSIDLYSEVYFSYLLFIIPLYFFTPRIKQRFFLRSHIPQYKSNTIYTICVFMLFFFLFFGISGESIISSGGYGRGEVTSLGGFSEYYVVFTILGIIYSGGKKIKKGLIVFLTFIIVLKFMLYGGRIALVQMFLLFFLLFFDTNSRHFSLKTIIAIILLSFYILLVLACLRTRFIYYIKNGSVLKLLYAPFENDFMKTLSFAFGNQNDIVYASSVFTQYAEKIGLFARTKLFFYNCMALFLPYSLLPKDANIVFSIQKTFANTGGGTLISTYYYLFLGNFGSILIGSIIGLVIRRFYRVPKQSLLFVLIFMLFLYPRWFGYNQIALFKMTIFCYLFHLIVKKIIKYLRI